MKDNTQEEDWIEGINKENLDKAVKAGEILPQLPLPVIPKDKSISDTIMVKIVTKPKKIFADKLPKGHAYFCEVEHQGARKTMVVPDSLRFNLAKECKLHDLKDDEGKLSPVGHWFIIGAHLQETKYGKETKLYWCQYKQKSSDSEDFEVNQQNTVQNVILRGSISNMPREELEKVFNSVKEILSASFIAVKTKDIEKKLKDRGFDIDTSEVLRTMSREGIIYEESTDRWKLV